MVYIQEEENMKMIFICVVSIDVLCVICAAVCSII